MSENWSAQVSIKTPAGTLINLRGENGDRVEQGLAWLTKVAPAIVEAEQAFGGVATVAATFPGSTVVEQSGPSWSQQGSQQTVAPQGATPQCVHGAREYKDFTSKAGKHIKMWACTARHLPREQQCDPEWVK